MLTIIKNLNCWRARTSVERCLTLVLGFACLAAIGLTEATRNRVAVLDEDTELPEVSKLSQSCHTDECKRTAQIVLSKMKLNVDPCNDFYEFACGNFMEKTEIPQDQVVVHIITLIRDKLHEQMKYIIEEERPQTDPKFLRLPNTLYKACMNEDLIESQGGKAIQEISDYLGGWPVVVGDSWNSDKTWSWQETVKKLRHLGFNTDYVVHLSNGVNLENSTQRILDLDQSVTGLEREFLLKGFNETLVREYHNYMVDLAVLLGADQEVAKKELKESLQFEMDLANISLPKEKRRNSSELYNLYSIKQLQEMYPYVQWLDYINSLLPEGLQVDENEIVNLKVPNFFKQLGKLLERTKKRTVANYMIWRVHKESVIFLSQGFRKRQLQYDSALLGKREQQARWKQCINMVEHYLEIPVGSLYVRKYFKKDSKEVVLDMVKNLREAFSDILDEIQWMDDKTKQEAKKKLYAITTHIGYPNELMDNDKLEELYHGLDIDAENYLESALNIKVLEKDYSFNQLRLPVNKTDWIRHAHPAVVNAFYSQIENSIQFPAGILQGYFFNYQRPMYMNYGSIGYVIGHEITHGFDDQGRQYDIAGNLKDWWQPDTKKAFLKKAQCIIEQYGSYTDKQTGLKLNGINTQGENIADNGGVKEAYLAYKKWVEKHGEEPTLPGLKYTPQQMFWISTGQTWCAKYTKEYKRNSITSAYHSPTEFRVLGMLRNSKEFSRDFQCPEGTAMNPVQKCQVW